MSYQVNDLATTTQIRIVESRGTTVGLPEDSVIGLLSLADPAHVLDRVNGMLTMHLDERDRPVIRLSDALRLAPTGAAPENQVVILRMGPMGSQLFGLLVERAGEPEQATVLPTRLPEPVLMPITQLVQLADGSIACTLNPIWLALSIGNEIDAVFSAEAELDRVAA